MNASVTVIIPNYNHSQYLTKRIESVLYQTYQDFEIIILDDKSTDNSREIIEKYRHNSKVSEIIYSERNSGNTFFQWKKGINFSKGKYIWIAESDDYADPSFLELMVKKFEENNNVGLVFCSSNVVDQDDKAIHNTKSFLLQTNPNLDWEKDLAFREIEAVKECLIYHNLVLNASSCVFLKEAFFKVGGIDEKFKLCGDWDLWIRIGLNYQISYVSRGLNYFREHQNNVRSKFKQKFKSEKERILLRKSIAVTNPLGHRNDATEVFKLNKDLVYKEYGYLGLSHLRTGNIVKGIFYVLYATLLPMPTTFFIKNGAYWLKIRLTKGDV